jgi:hypothetical protein
MRGKENMAGINASMHITAPLGKGHKGWASSSKVQCSTTRMKSLKLSSECCFGVSNHYCICICIPSDMIRTGLQDRLTFPDVHTMSLVVAAHEILQLRTEYCDASHTDAYVLGTMCGYTRLLPCLSLNPGIDSYCLIMNYFQC